MNSESATQNQPTEFTPIVMNESPVEGLQQDRRMSDEWDASKVPPSRFQKRKGSIYATPSSRDGHVDRNYAEKFHAKFAEMNRRGSRS
ncbi:uncharacterized protein F5Z01DRAFT_671156 [Emericellopsis atlantica]|uniref:Uncharacterized protein n=1 Tax=Emericellopsis atlantica TaxID=2614577 RepID=A0A9P7ZT13_9HYPO|nr:uncharacterized protein F5Z01DRAFT_671156 [Emericellopsis atlantica]KAG9257561.1 hypothetical protein F5Z01DRAFT_671156 [Emericellopsis atlantica]